MVACALAGPQDSPASFEFYGYTTGAAPRLGFLREWQQIYIVAEGDLVKERYRVVRIGEKSAVIEDTSTSQQRTLPLAPGNPDSAITPIADASSVPEATKPPAVQPPARRRRRR